MGGGNNQGGGFDWVGAFILAGIVAAFIALDVWSYYQ